MGILSKLFGGGPRNGLVDDVLRGWGLIAAPASSGVRVTAEQAMRCAAVYACVRVIAESIAQLPLPVYVRTAGGGKQRDAAHPIAQLLNQRPNLWQTPFEFREMMVGFVCLRGNAFAYINRVRGDVPTELIPLSPGTVRVEQNDDFSLTYFYTPPNKSERPIPRRNLLHLRGLSTGGPLGMTPITAYRESVGLAITAETHQSKSFANGARFRGYIKHPTKLTPEAAKRLREDFDSRHGGENAYKTPLLEEGMDWVTAGMNDADAKTIETRKMARADIASIFRVPPHMIGDLERATFSNIEHQSIEFVTHSLVPWCKRWEGAIQRDLFGEAERETHFAEHLLEGLLRGDTASRYAAYHQAISDGWMNRNEARVRENLNPVDGLNEFLVPLNMGRNGE